MEKNLFYGPIKLIPTTFSAADKERLTTAYKAAIIEKVAPAYRGMGEFFRDEYLPKARASTGISDLKGGREQYQYWVRRCPPRSQPSHGIPLRYFAELYQATSL